MTHAMEHCHRPWWKRPPVWFIGAVVLVLIVAVVEQTGKRAATPLTPYSTFLDQVEAGNVASVRFEGTEITGQFKHPLDSSGSAGTVQSDSFRSRVPDFGDPTLIPVLHKQHVLIDVTSPSAWSWLLGRVPWPMLIFVAAMLVAAFLRMLRGGKAQSGSAVSTLPTHGMMGLVSGLFAKQPPGASPPTRDSDETKNHR